MRCVYVYSISYKIEKEIAQGRPIDIDDVKTEKCGINYSRGSRLACEITTDKKDDSFVCLAAVTWSEKKKKYISAVPCNLDFFLSLRVIFLYRQINTTTVVSQTR